VVFFTGPPYHWTRIYGSRDLFALGAAAAAGPQVPRPSRALILERLMRAGVAGRDQFAPHFARRVALGQQGIWVGGITDDYS